MMADIDISDDLLDLAGGGGSDEEGSVTPRRDGSSSQSPPRARKEADSVASHKQKPHARDDESEEEGEAQSAPGTPNSLDSAPMDESDSEDEQPVVDRTIALDNAADTNEKYPVDGMFVSKAEREEIMALREVEREQILAERVLEIERQRQNLLLRQMVTSVENEERKHDKKRSADWTELEQDERKTRPRTTKASETAMDSLRRARAEKQRRKEDQERRKEDASPGRSLGEARSNDGDDFARPRSVSPNKEEEKAIPPAELIDYERVRIGRNEFAQVDYTPGFETALTGCFIRISVGAHPETGIEQYRMAVIKDVIKGKPYALTTATNKRFITNKYVKAAHGKSAREFPFISASNGKFTDSELNRYRITCQNESVPLPTKQMLIDKIDAINGLIHYNWTQKEINERLSRRNGFKKRFDPTLREAERERLSGERDEAAQQGDKKRVAELDEQLTQCTQRLAFGTSLSPPKGAEASKSSMEQDRLAERNRENRRMNVESVRKAQLREKAKVREIEKAIQRGEQVPDDLSRRLRTKAKFVHDVNEMAKHIKGGQGAPESEDNTAASTPAKESTPVPGAAAQPQMATHLARLREKQREDCKGVPTIHKPLTDDEIIGSLDLDIDVEI